MAIESDVYYAKLDNIIDNETTGKTYTILFFDEETCMFARWAHDDDFYWREKPKYPRNLK